jgi:secreted trypsin-like serine protease
MIFVFNLILAHCTAQFNKNITVRCGTSTKEKGGFVYDIVDIIPHFEYQQRTMINDAAILKPSQKIRINNRNTKIIPILSNDEFKEDGTVCKVSGWGLKENNEKPNNLRAVDVEIINHLECKSNYSIPGVRFNIAPQMLCAGSSEGGGRDACSGDSVRICFYHLIVIFMSTIVKNKKF